jgi:hypothetical protein
MREHRFHPFLIGIPTTNLKSKSAPVSWGAPAAEEVGFEPTEALTSPVFKTGTFGRSVTLPGDQQITSTNANP